MKKFIYLSVITLLTAMLVSCSTQFEEPEPGNMSTINNETIVSLTNYNKSLLHSNPTRTAKGAKDKKNNKGLTQWQVYQISMQDFIGAAAGMGSVHAIAAAIGAGTAGTGYFITCGVAGAMCSVGYSYRAYKDCKGFSHINSQLPSDGPLFVTAQNAFINSCDSLKNDKTNKYVYNEVINKIHLPKEFNYLKNIGENHNGILRIALANEAQTEITTRAGNIDGPSLGKLPTGGWIPSTNYPINYMNKVVYSKELKDAYNEQLSKEMPSNINQFIDNNFVSSNVKEALKLYANLYKEYPTSIDDIVIIANNYIDTIENNKDFTNKDKEIIYSALIVSVYSPYLWGEEN